MSVTPDRLAKDQFMAEVFYRKHGAARPGDVTPEATARIGHSLAVEAFSRRLNAMLDPAVCNAGELTGVGQARDEARLAVAGLPAEKIDGADGQALLARVGEAMVQAQEQARLRREARAAALRDRLGLLADFAEPAEVQAHEAEQAGIQAERQRLLASLAGAASDADLDRAGDLVADLEPRWPALAKTILEARQAAGAAIQQVLAGLALGELADPPECSEAELAPVKLARRKVAEGLEGQRLTSAEVGTQAPALVAAVAEAVDAARQAALAAAIRKYEADLLALQDGELKSVPASAPTGLASEFDAVAAARSALKAAPLTRADCEAAALALADLQAKVKAYLAAAALALSAARKAYDEARAALESGDLAAVPASAPAGLGAEHGAVASAKAGLPADPKTIDDYLGGSQALVVLKEKVALYLKAAAKKNNLDQGVALFSSTGSKLAELAGHDTLNAAQKAVLDESLRKALASGDVALSETQLKEMAQRIVVKTQRLAEAADLEAVYPGLNASIAKSETLKTSVVKLQHAGWRITVNADAGGYCDPVSREISIEPGQSLEDLIGTLAHETGHAGFTALPVKPTAASSASGLAYVRECTRIDFLDEGEAQMVACRVRKDLEAEGITANVPADQGDFTDIYDRFLGGELNEDQARIEMAKKFGALEVSIPPFCSYQKYYGESNVDAWNAAHTDPADQLSPDVLDTLVLF